MRCLKGQYLWFVVLEVDFLDYVIQGSVEDLLLSGWEGDVSGEVGGAENVGNL